MAMVKCKECGKEVSSKVRQCPHCGVSLKMSKLKIFLLVIIGLSVLGILTSKNDTTGISNTNSVELELQDGWKIKTEAYGVKYVVGKIKNNTSKTYSYVQVNFNTYDKEGVMLGSVLANTNNLEAHGTWKFKAHIYPTKGVVSTKFKGITSY